MASVRKSKIFGRAIVVSALLLSAVACNTNDRGGLKVANGTDDVGANALFPATMYIQMEGVDLDDKPKTIRNVGTLVDLSDFGLQDKYGLILSLGDLLVENASGNSVLPLFKTVNLTFFLPDEKSQIVPKSINGLMFQQDPKQVNKIGVLKDATGVEYQTLSVGFVVDKVSSSSIPADKAQEVAQRLFMAAPLPTANGKEMRNPHTAFQMIAIPKSVLANLGFGNLVAPKMVAAEDRPEEKLLKGQKLSMVGYGEKETGSAAGEAGKTWSLTPSLPNVKPRNYKEVTPLNSGLSDVTPLRQMIGVAPATTAQLWEVSGSGLCGSDDGVNYDTGAAIYLDTNKFVGFAVASTVRNAGYRGKLNCKSTVPENMATVIVTPSRAIIEKFVSQAK